MIDSPSSYIVVVARERVGLTTEVEDVAKARTESSPVYAAKSTSSSQRGIVLADDG